MYHMGSENDNEPVYRETKSGFMGDCASYTPQILKAYIYIYSQTRNSIHRLAL